MSQKQPQAPFEPILYFPDQSPFAVLGLTQQATADEIKSAYFAQVRLYPPEREPVRFKEIRAAYDRLKTAEQRIETEQRTWQPWQAPPLPAPLELDLTVHEDDLLAVLRASSDLEARDLRKQFRDIRW